MSNDAQLLRCYAEEKSEAAFAELVQRHLDLVYSAALRQVWGDPHHAQDVTQVVFTALARKAAAVANHPVLVGWLYTSTQRAAAKVRRTEARRRAREHEAYLMQQLTSLGSSTLAWEQLRPVLDDAMRELGDRDREAVLLRFFAQQPFAEIGATLNLSEDAARMRLDRALEKLRTLLARRGVTSTAAALATALANQAVTAAPAGLTAVVCSTAFAQVAAASGGAVAGVLTFMNAIKFTALLGAAFAALAVATATRQVLASRAAAQSLAAARQEDEASSARLRDLEQRVQAAEQDRRDLQRKVDDERALQATEKARAAKAAADERAAKTKSQADEQLAAGQAFLSRHPDVKQALLDRSRARVDSRFRPLYRTLNLAPAQIEQFEKLLMEGEGVNSVNPISKEQLILTPSTGLTREEVESGVRDLLGDAGYQQYQEARRMVIARQFAQDVAGALYFTNTPLTTEQAAQLARTVDAARTATGQGRGGGSEYWNAVLTDSRAFLSEPQLAAVAGFQQQEQFQSELSRARTGWFLPGWDNAKLSAK